MNRLPPLDPLASVVAAAVPADGVGALDALRVDDASAGLWVAALLDPCLLPQGGQHRLGHLGLFPLLEVPVDGLPGREVGRQVPPGAARPDQVHDAVHNGPSRVLLGPATVTVGRLRAEFEQTATTAGPLRTKQTR